MAIFKTGGNFKSNAGHFYINFEYKTHLNFGGNFLKKKVCLIVRKIRYTSYKNTLKILSHKMKCITMKSCILTAKMITTKLSSSDLHVNSGDKCQRTFCRVPRNLWEFKICVCFNANPQHYYVLWDPQYVDRWH